MTSTMDKKLFTVSINSGLSFEDTVTTEVLAENKEEALRTAMEKFNDYSSWNNFVNDI